jgi:catechol 2,3-dioxygenase-like lactoylglutathione lyase family enzyme
VRPARRRPSNARPARRGGAGSRRRPAPGLGIVGFDHVDLRTRDRDRLRRYLVDRLGLDVVGEGPDHTFLLFGDQVLGLRDGLRRRPRDRRRADSAIDHVALRVQRWAGLAQAAKSRGLRIVGERAREESRSVYLRAPSGLRIELVYRPDPHRHPVHPPAVAPGTTASDGLSDANVRPRRRRGATERRSRPRAV